MATENIRYYIKDEAEAKCAYETYVSPRADEDLYQELLYFPMQALSNACKQGLIKGDTLIDSSYGLSIYPLLTVYKCFKDITILQLNDSLVEGTKKWLCKDPGALDWSHACKIAAKLEGCSDNWEGMEDDLREHVTQILKCDLKEENPTDPVTLKKADCVINLFLLGAISKDINEYSSYAKTIYSFLKPGGCLLLIGVFGGKYYEVNGERYNVLNFSKEDLNKIMTDVGFSAEQMEVFARKQSISYAFYEEVFYCRLIKPIEN
uniref:Nicotinamide N-methyltransferase n=1 Tax=Leptobrachium leishanense TaxID=445787 RepID=A0A8C5R7Y6_9ANUR